MTGDVFTAAMQVQLCVIGKRVKSDTVTVSLCREDITTAATRLKECIIDVGRWMSANRLKLNTDKT